MKSKAHRLPRKLKKALTMARPFWCNRRLEAKYQYIFGPSSKGVTTITKYDRCVFFWQAYDLEKLYNEPISQLFGKIGLVIREHIDCLADTSLRNKYLLSRKQRKSLKKL